MQKIVSKDNGRIKRLKGLAMKKVRISENLFLVEGTKMVEEALSSEMKLDTVLISESYSCSQEYISAIEAKGTEVLISSDEILKKVSSLVTPQGIIAAVRIQEYSLESIISSGRPVVVLDGINDPGNMGTILRTADAFGFGGVLITGDCVDPYNPKVVQASMGSILRTRHCIADVDDLKKLRDAGYNLYGLDPRGEELDGNFSFNQMNALLIGSESHGLRETFKDFCDVLVRIPMQGETESLNAAVAAGIAMFLAGGYGRI